MSWVAVGAAAVTVVGGYFSNKEANKGASKGANAQVGEQRRQYDQTRTDLMPWLQAGQGALTQMQQLNAGNFDSFKTSPDYQFAYDQGMQSLDRSAASRGGLYSGGHSADLMKFGSGLASQNYNNYYNRLAGLAQVGQTTGGSLGEFGANAATNIGNARASAYNQIGQNNAQFAAGTAGALGNLWGSYMGGRS
jgi:hypothetical protein